MAEAETGGEIERESASGENPPKINFLRQFRDSTSRKFKKVTASQFMEVWNHYDLDGNGFIEGTELDGFLREFVSSVNVSDVGVEALSETAMAHLKETFMDAYDDNGDDKIDIAELAQILPTEESFLLLFRRHNPLSSSVEFMKVWREYDTDSSGFIEPHELKAFLKHLLVEANQDVPDDKLSEYTQTMLKLFDSNKDGKLQLSEMSQLLPVKENYLSVPILKGASQITRGDIDRVFDQYDLDRNGTIEDEELTGFLKDLMELAQKDYNASDIQVIRDAILEHWDVNHDGKISRSELRMLLLQQCRLAAEQEGIPFEEDDQPEVD